MITFKKNDRVIHKNGKCGTVIHNGWGGGVFVPVKFDDGTIDAVPRYCLAKLERGQLI